MSSPLSIPMTTTDAKTEELVEYETDYAFFVLGPNPFSRQHKLVMAAGLHAEGAKCVLDYLLKASHETLDEVRNRAHKLQTASEYLSGLVLCARGQQPQLVEAAAF